MSASWMWNLRDTCAATAIVVVTMSAWGCGDSGDLARYPVAGQVTFQGAPVPSGTILFEPDASQGNQGPAAMSSIQNGYYEVPRKKGVVGGPHLVRVIGYGPSQEDATDGNDDGDDQLFPEFVQAIVLERQSITLDIDVPARAEP